MAAFDFHENRLRWDEWIGKGGAPPARLNSKRVFSREAREETQRQLAVSQTARGRRKLIFTHGSGRRKTPRWFHACQGSVAQFRQTATHGGAIHAVRLQLVHEILAEFLTDDRSHGAAAFWASQCRREMGMDFRRFQAFF